MHHLFRRNIRVYAIFNDQSFNDTLTNDIVSFEQLGPDLLEIGSEGGILIYSVRQGLRGLDTLDRFSACFYKGGTLVNSCF